MGSPNWSATRHNQNKGGARQTRRGRLAEDLTPLTPFTPPMLPDAPNYTQHPQTGESPRLLTRSPRLHVSFGLPPVHLLDLAVNQQSRRRNLPALEARPIRTAVLQTSNIKLCDYSWTHVERDCPKRAGAKKREKKRADVWTRAVSRRSSTHHSSVTFDLHFHASKVSHRRRRKTLLDHPTKPLFHDIYISNSPCYCSRENTKPGIFS